MTTFKQDFSQQLNGLMSILFLICESPCIYWANNVYFVNEQIKKKVLSFGLFRIQCTLFFLQIENHTKIEGSRGFEEKKDNVIHCAWHGCNVL